MASAETNNLEELEKRLDAIRNRNKLDYIHLHSLKLVLAQMKNKESRLKTEAFEHETRLGDIEMSEQRRNNERHYNKNLTKLLFEYTSMTRLSAPDSYKRDNNIKYHLEALTGFQKDIGCLKKRRGNLMTVQTYRKLQEQENDINQELNRLVNTYNNEHEEYRRTFCDLNDKTNKLILGLVINAEKLKKKMTIDNTNVLSLSNDGSLIQSNRNTQYSQKYQLVPINIRKLEEFKIPEILPIVEFRGCEQNMTTKSYTKRVIQVTNSSTVRTTTSPQELGIQNDEEISYAVSSVEITEVRNGRQEYVENNSYTKKPSPLGKDGIQLENNHGQQRASVASPSRYDRVAHNYSRRGALNGRAILKEAIQKDMVSMSAENMLESMEYDPKVHASNGNQVPISESKKIIVLSNVLVKGPDKETSNFDEQAVGSVRRDKNVEESKNVMNINYSISSESMLVAETETQGNLHSPFAEINRIPYYTGSAKTIIPKQQFDAELQNRRYISKQMNMKQTADIQDVAKKTRAETMKANSEAPSSHITIESSNENVQQANEQLFKTMPPLHSVEVSNDNFFSELNKSPGNNSNKRKAPAVAQNNNDEDDFDFFNFNTPKRSKSGTDSLGNDFADFADILNSPTGGGTDDKVETGVDSADDDFFNLNCSPANVGKEDNLFDMKDFLDI